ncbi:MAG: divalent-cation tolerance protein CutA [Leptolyngbyaceae bacterium]|nr:divalent-cation tolerance protein CutA [Leptolyngbyaceae bacterium]
MTASSKEEAKAIANQLIEERLAACINILPVQSIYRWNGSICDDEEWQLIIKTDLTQFTSLQERAIALHSYDVPELIAIPVVQGYAPYLHWMIQEIQHQFPKG